MEKERKKERKKEYIREERVFFCEKQVFFKCV